MIHKILILAVLAWLVFRIRQYFKSESIRKHPSNKGNDDMVACETCRLFLPATEAIQDQGHYYCSRNHVPRTR